MSIREFAAHLGVSERMISKWEAGKGDIRPRPINQAALDTCLNRSDSDTWARFSHLTNGSLVSGAAGEGASLEPIGSSEVRHPSDGSPMVKVDGSVFQSGPSNEPVWLPAFYIDVHPVSNAEYARFVAATGHTPPQHWTDGQYPQELEWCSTESTPGRHELKGGAWTSPFDRATPSSFNDAAETMCDDDTGFRCAVAADALEKLL
ncbi:helix-turn-helix domain-containing protein [Parasphingorhabdus pacifica]